MKQIAAADSTGSQPLSVDIYFSLFSLIFIIIILNSYLSTAQLMAQVTQHR